MIKLVKVMMFSTLLSALGSCGASSSENLSSPAADGVVAVLALPADALTWETGGSDLVERNCASCHSSYGKLEGVREDRENMLEAIKDGSMPKKKAPDWSKDKDPLVNYLTNGTDLK
jgi:cytochrome c5